MNKLNWLEFDECIYSISMRCKNKKFDGVYGFPRGGLCLAVALSHSLGLHLLDKPKNNSLIVDDIYDTGYTLEKIKHIKIEIYTINREINFSYHINSLLLSSLHDKSIDLKLNNSFNFIANS